MSIRATFSYFQGMEGDMYQFYRIPKLLFTSEYFKNLSCEAKVLYGLMLDRMSLSIKNRWLDEEDRVYIFFSVEEIMEMLNCGRNKAVNCLKELDQETGIGLIEKKRLGLGKANVIYVKNFSLREYPDEPAEMEIETDDPEYEEQIPCNFEENMPENAVNTQKFEKQTSRSLENKLQEVSKTNFKKFQKQTVIILNITIMNQVRLNHILLSIMTGKMWIRWMRGMHIVKSFVKISNTTFFVRAISQKV